MVGKTRDRKPLTIFYSVRLAPRLPRYNVVYVKREKVFSMGRWNSVSSNADRCLIKIKIK